MQQEKLINNVSKLFLIQGVKCHIEYNTATIRLYGNNKLIAKQYGNAPMTEIISNFMDNLIYVDSNKNACIQELQQILFAIEAVMK